MGYTVFLHPTHFSLVPANAPETLLAAFYKSAEMFQFSAEKGLIADNATNWHDIVFFFHRLCTSITKFYLVDWLFWFDNLRSA